ncbi:hypothetical protein DL765_009820 [Monosporascus sp. GIB2]|nr:hypothetical protein DL765_009820 [Monosporascus sp. GIB2]
MAISKLVTAFALVAYATANVLAQENKEQGTGTSTFSYAPGAPDGFYVHAINNAGYPENIFIGDLKDMLPPVANDTNTHTRRKEKQGDIYCKNQYTINYDDLVAAEQGLERMYQDGGSFSGKSTSYKYGSAVAYGCNYGNGQTITGSWLAAQYAAIGQKCGSNSPGWVAYPDWKSSYGVDQSGVGFC